MDNFILPLFEFSNKTAQTLLGYPAPEDPFGDQTVKEIEMHWWDYVLFCIYFVFTITNLCMLIKYIMRVMTLTAFIMTTNLLASVCK